MRTALALELFAEAGHKIAVGVQASNLVRILGGEQSGVLRGHDAAQRVVADGDDAVDPMQVVVGKMGILIGRQMSDPTNDQFMGGGRRSALAAQRACDFGHFFRLTAARRPHRNA